MRIKIQGRDNCKQRFYAIINITLIKALLIPVEIWELPFYTLPCENQDPAYQEGHDDRTWIHVRSFVPSTLLFRSIVISTIENPRLFYAVPLN